MGVRLAATSQAAQVSFKNDSDKADKAASKMQETTKRFVLDLLRLIWLIISLFTDRSSPLAALQSEH